MDFFTVEFYPDARRDKKEKGKKCIGYWPAFSYGYYDMCIPIAIWGRTIFWIMNPFGKYSCFIVGTGLLLSVFVVHSKLQVHWPLKRGKVFQVTPLCCSTIVKKKKKCLYCSPVSTAFLPNCFGHIFWWRAAKAYCPKRMRTLNLEYLRCKYWSGLICHQDCKDYSTTSAIMIIISLCAETVPKNMSVQM